MEIKAEVFKAIDSVDHSESYFIIYSIDGEDVAYNCISADGFYDEMIERSKENGFIRWNDFKSSPRRSDMIEPELIEVFYLDK